jgi:hypothetical protein
MVGKMGGFGLFGVVFKGFKIDDIIEIYQTGNDKNPKQKIDWFFFDKWDEWVKLYFYDKRVASHFFC